MKRTIKALATALLATGLLLGGATAAFAKGGHHHRGGEMFEKLETMSEQERLEFMENKLDKRVAKMQQKLDLTPEQTAKVRQIVADSQTQLLDVWERNKDAEDKSAARAEAKAVFKKSRAELRALLTPEQQQKLKQHRGKHAGRFKGKMLERLDEKLELTDAQKVKVEAVLDETHREMKAIHKSDRDDKRAAARAVREKSSTQIRALLTAEQQVKYDALREKMKERHHGRHGHKR